MAIEQTVGGGGDYAEWKAAWEWLVTQVPLGGVNYDFFQIGSVAGAAGVWTQIDDNSGSTIRFICPSADSHFGNPTRGYVTDLAPDRQINISINSGNLTNTYIVDGLRIVRTARNTAGNINMLGMGNSRCQNIARNLIIKGWDDTINGDVGYGGINFDRANEHIYNCKIYNCGFRAIGANGGTFGPAADGIKTIEDVTIYNCLNGIRTITEIVSLTARNVVTASPMGAGRCWNQANFVFAQNWNIINCAGSDGTLLDLEATGKLNVENPQDNIVPADEFDSIVENSRFLFLPNGEAEMVITANPRRGKAPLKVQFTADVEYREGSLRLGKTGAETELATVDIAGEAIPGADGKYSIGCHEQVYDLITPEL